MWEADLKLYNEVHVASKKKGNEKLPLSSLVFALYVVQIHWFSRMVNLASGLWWVLLDSENCARAWSAVSPPSCWCSVPPNPPRYPAWSTENICMCYIVGLESKAMMWCICICFSAFLRESPHFPPAVTFFMIFLIKTSSCSCFHFLVSKPSVPSIRPECG